ncbi:MAG TPA: hypothetical protein VGO01_11375 [Bradyrhizobium sp.]|jgi:alkanesulfonate monooxygenase SsuD/methylene tetrahydromethanopterin reductase-like flavin-dependent oxidoreductase (luciferase family)|nr:hypothetical protein [Bradyrhizobium sp.]
MATTPPFGDRVSYQLIIEKPKEGRPPTYMLVADRPITIPVIGEYVDLYLPAEDGQQFSGTVSAVKRYYEVTSGMMPKLTCVAWVTLS